MRTAIRLVDLPDDSSFVPLGVLGYCLTRTGFLSPVWAELDLPLKTVDHAPAAKLQDVLTSILAGCRSIAQINCCLCPDVALARAWGRERFAEQSTLARTLDAFTVAEVSQLRQGSDTLFRRESRTLCHDFGQDFLWLDIDLTPLPTSKRAEASTKGKFSQKNRYGRQLARVHAPRYHETLFSQLYPGKQESSPAYVPTVQALDAFLHLTIEHKQRTVLRSDAGFGSDANINYALSAQWQVLTKNKGGRRPDAYARRVAEDAWQSLRDDRWVAPVAAAPVYTRPTACLLLRWLAADRSIKHALIVSSVTTWTMAETIAQYDDRGACETEIQADKGGLQLERRRKTHLAAQEALVLLTDLAHNVLAWMVQWMFVNDAVAGFGTSRLIEDVLRVSGRLFFDGERLTEVQLNRQHPYADTVATGLERLLAHFGQP
jgi:hypothetical protein